MIWKFIKSLNDQSEIDFIFGFFLSICNNKVFFKTRFKKNMKVVDQWCFECRKKLIFILESWDFLVSLDKIKQTMIKYGKNWIKNKMKNKPNQNLKKMKKLLIDFMQGYQHICIYPNVQNNTSNNITPSGMMCVVSVNNGLSCLQMIVAILKHEHFARENFEVLIILQYSSKATFACTQ